MEISVDIKRKLGDFKLDVSFKSNAGRIGILGASGCGKSLTLRSIAGIEKPDSGMIRINDRVLFDSSEKTNVRPQKRNVGYMFQNYALFPTMTVEDNIAAGLSSGIDRAARTAEMIERFKLKGLEKHLPEQLSGGQQQRVALARIMAYSPEIVLLDEPFSALDQHLKERLQHEMMEMIEDYRGQMIMVSHSRDEIYRFSEDVIVMEEGSVIGTGEPRKIFNDPKTVATARMTGCKNIVGARRIDEHTLFVPDWDLELHLKKVIPEGTDAIGYRAHFFEPVWGEKQENCIPFDMIDMDELPFEKRFYIRPAGSSDEAESICWFLQKSSGIKNRNETYPDHLRLREDAVMLLRR